ncbi:conserved hypothetical protein [Cupriavidus taiwanensis]|nr:conserved hypothetical protein [Cupriavidus taiwanensis]
MAWAGFPSSSQRLRKSPQGFWRLITVRWPAAWGAARPGRQGKHPLSVTATWLAARIAPRPWRVHGPGNVAQRPAVGAARREGEYFSGEGNKVLQALTDRTPFVI